MSESRRVRALALPDLPMILTWRNHPAVRSVMFSQHEISRSEHEAWFERASADPSRRLLVVEDGDGPFGFVQFDAVVENGVADWGFYARPDAPRGSGRRLGAAALDHAFAALNLHKVCGQAIATNDASITLHRKLGFTEEGVLRDQKYVNGSYYSLVCFGMLKQEWPGSRHYRSPYATY